MGQEAGSRAPRIKIELLLIPLTLCVAVYLGWRTYSSKNLRVSIPRPDLSASESMVAEKILHLTSSLDSNPRSPGHWGRLAMNFHVHDFQKAAITCYAQAHKLDPDNFDWPYLSALLQSQEWVSESALDWFARAKKIKGDYSPLYIRLGTLLYQMGRLDEAQKAFINAAAHRGDPYYFNFGQAQIAFARGDMQGAMGFLHNALNYQTRSTEAKFLLAEVHKRLNNIQMADSIRPHRDSALHTTTLGDSVYSILASEGVSHKWFEKRGSSYLNQQLWIPAAREFIQQINSNPTQAAFEKLNTALYQMHISSTGYDMDLMWQAAAALERGMQFYPDNIPLMLNQGLVFSALKKFKESIALHEKVVALEPRTQLAYTSMGIAWSKLGDQKKSGEIFSQGLKYFPENSFMKTSLTLIYINDSASTPAQKNKALTMAQELASEENSHRARNLDLLAFCYFVVNKKEMAIKTARQGLTLARQNKDRNLIAKIEKSILNYR